MGNCVASSSFNKQIKWKNSDSDQKLLRVIKVDGKVMEYTTSILVKDLLLSYHGFGVGFSKNSSQLLSPDHELRMGRAYHLLPLDHPQFSDSHDLKPSVMQNDEMEEDRESKRVKVVLTKQQLQELVSMNISIKELISAARGYKELSRENSISWKPKLDTILEENE